MRILFMGTPRFAVPSLEKLAADGHDVCGVFTQPDKPQNRGMKLRMSPVKEAALTHGLDVYQPATLRGGQALELAAKLDPELIAVVAYGKLLPKAFLELPRYGCVNIHGSLLPKYRGAAPVQWAVLNGERETGVTAMYMAEELDAGDVIASRRTEIGGDETSGELMERLGRLGAELLGETVKDIGAGRAQRLPQDHGGATGAPALTKELSPIDWTRPSGRILDQIRGLNPWPAAETALDGAVIKIFAARAGGEAKAPPGAVLGAGKAGLEVCCGDFRSIFITELQAAGKKRMPAADFLRGNPVAPGVLLGRAADGGAGR